MATLIKFRSRPPRSGSAYQLHRYAPDGRVLGTVPIEARDDIEARRHAQALTGGFRAELWSNGRFLEQVGFADHPVAAAIRLL